MSELPEVKRFEFISGDLHWPPVQSYMAEQDDGEYVTFEYAESLRQRLADAEEEIRVSDLLLTARNELLSAIPACEGHGDQCIPHAIEWVKNIQERQEAAEKDAKKWRAVSEEMRRAIGDHFAPGYCYATGPMTGDAIRDLVECPACSAIAMYEAALTTADQGAGVDDVCP